MKNIFTKTLVIALISLSFLSASNVFAIGASDITVAQTTADSYCVNGGDMNITDFARAFSAGLITFEMGTTSDNKVAGFLLKNATNCTLPISLASYKMYDGVLSHQELFEGTGLVHATSTTLISVQLPSCMAQIDAWYGLHPEQLLDSNPYGYPNVPMVLAFRFLYNSGTGYHDASGPFCEKEIPNTPPVITLIGANPTQIVAGSGYVDAGATALDLEDGNITANIVTISNVHSNVPGSYTVKYNVKDSKGLSAVEVVRVVNVVPAPNTPPVITLVGANPTEVMVGNTYTDAGATALDLEDGNITSSIVASSTVNSNVVGSYTVKYNVKDSKGLSAVEVVRVVNVVPKPVAKTVTIQATKIVCQSESDLPNYGAGGPDISSTTASKYVVEHPNCKIVPWVFEYDDATENPGDQLVTGGTAWTAFGATTSIEVSNKKIWVREQFNKDYIPFTGLNTTQSVSAELYCDSDVLNYDNYDYLMPTVAGKTYHCVGWNVLKQEPAPNKCVVPNTLGDTERVVFGTSPEPTLATIINTSGISVSDQKEYQVWSTSKASSTVQIKFINGYSDASNVFGYYKKGQPDTFVPLFKYGNGINNIHAGVATATPGQVYTVNLPQGDYGFAVKNKYNSVDNFQKSENSLNEGANDHMASYDVLSSTNTASGSYIIAFEDLALAIADKDYNDIVVQVTVAACEDAGEEENQRPVITLIGANPANINAGDVYTDPGATAFDKEDGDISSKITASSTVNTSIPGSYKITYNVSDSKGLKAVEVSRTVNVLEVEPEKKGKITFCLMVKDSQNIIATSTYGLPQGEFSIHLASSTANVSSTTIQTKIWKSATFSPNRKTILNINDSDCVTYSNLPYGTYHYSKVTTTGSEWDAALYNDQDTQPVNNVFDFFSYSTTSANSDGHVVVGENRSERTVVLISSYKEAPQCVLPKITSPLSASVTVNSLFSYKLTASSTTDTLSVSTTTLPAWLSFATTTNTLSGTPTTVGTYNVELKAQNICGLDLATLVISVVAGGGGPTSDLDVIKTADKTTVNPGDNITYTITLVNRGPNNGVGITLTDLLPATLTLVTSTTTSGTYATTTGIWTIGTLANNATTTLTMVATVNAGTHGQKITNTAVASSGQTDPVSANNTSSVDVTVNPAPCTSNCGGGGGGGGGGGNGPIVGSLTSAGNGQIITPVVAVPKSCYYLYDYLRKDFINNPVEVKKLQVFLRDLEGFTTVQVTGVYDDQTIVALDAFQDRYKGEILTPWGHTAPTSYTYILTKKKVNEIYCKMAFPVNAQQQEEIDNYRNFLQGLRDSGIILEDGTTPVNPSNPSNPTLDGQVGSTGGTGTTGPQGTLAGYSSTTQSYISNLTANVIASGKKFFNSLLGLFGWPFNSGADDTNQGGDNTYLGMGWLNLLLILIIIIISYLWYRQYSNNKKIEEINKQIDLE